MRTYAIALLALFATASTSVVSMPAKQTSPTAPRGVLAGTVVTDDASPRPLRRATVRLTGDAMPSARLVGTDDAGRFVFDGVPAGSYTLSASKPGFVETHHGAPVPWQGPGVPVAVGDGARVDVTLALLPGAVIAGRITGPFGQPVRSLEVTAIDVRTGDASPRSWQASTDDLGEFRIYGLPPGGYLLSAVPRLDALRSAAGVRDVGDVVATTEAEARWARAATTGVSSASNPLPAAGRAVTYAPVFYPGTTQPDAAATVSVSAGDERTGLDLALQIVPVARLDGTLVDMNGGAVSPAIVNLYPRRSDRPTLADQLVSARAVTLPRATVLGSRFVATGVPPGEYTLVARSGSATERVSAQAPPAAERLWAVMDVSVSGVDQTNLVLRFARGLQVAGAMRFQSSSQPVPEDASAIQVSLVTTGTRIGQASQARAVVNRDAGILFESLAPGSYVLQATMPAALAGAGWTLKSAMLEGRDLADLPLRVEPGDANLDGLTVTFTDRAAEIAGRLVDADDRPVARYAVVVVTTDRSLWRPNARRIRAVSPATDGSFRVAGLPPGEYAVAAVDGAGALDLSDPGFLDRLVSAGYRLTLADGERKQQDLRIGG